MNRPPHLSRFLLAVILGTASAYAGLATCAWAGAVGANATVDSPDESLPLAVGDFNGDGIADVVETAAPHGERGLHSISVLLGRADGTFRRVVSHDTIGREPRALAVGDFNGDGKLDVIVGDGDGSLLEFFGDGKGYLVRSGVIATVGSVVSIAVGHFTQSGKLDLAVADFNSNAVMIFLGAGDGTFKETWSFALPQQGKEFHLASADFNQDGVADLAITSEEDGNYEVMLGNGNGTFTYAPKLSHLKDPNSYCPT